MSWLPRKLAPHVRCIFSSVMDSHQYKTVISRESKPIELQLLALDLESRSVSRNTTINKVYLAQHIVDVLFLSFYYHFFSKNLIFSVILYFLIFCNFICFICHMILHMVKLSIIYELIYTVIYRCL